MVKKPITGIICLISLALSTVVTVGLGASPAGATQNFDNYRVADAAIAEVGSSRPTGWNQPGECIKSAQRWVATAGGNFGGGGVISGYVNSGATEVSLGNTVKGDIIQYTNGNGADSDWSYSHTVVVVSNLGNGSFDIVQSNVPLGSGKVTRVGNWRPAPASGWVARAWRFGRTTSQVVQPYWHNWQVFSGVLITSTPAVTTWGRGRLDVFARNASMQLIHRWLIGSTWSDWESLGAPVGYLASAPAAVAWASGRIDIFVKGIDMSLWHKWYDNGQWYNWESLGGILTSAPAVASWASGRLDVFARGVSGELIHKWYSGGWSSWESLGGYLTSDPAAVSWGPGRIDVFAGGIDFAIPGQSTLYHKWFDGQWFGWEYLGGTITSAPAVSSWAPGRLDVFARGQNCDLIHKWWYGRWDGWESLGGGLVSAPAVISWSAGAIDIFILGTDNRMWQKYFDS